MAFAPDPRDLAIRDFLAGTDWAPAERRPLGQDASTRRYERLQHPDGRTAILMDAPPIEDPPCPPDASEAERRKLGWNALTRLAASRVDAFAAIAAHLKALGLSSPDIHHADPATGLAVIEDFGTANEFARVIERGAADETALYTAAAEALAHLHAHPLPEIAEGDGVRWPLLAFDDLALRTNADLFIDHYPAYQGRVPVTDAGRARWECERDALIGRAGSLPRRFTLRDYHAENLVWLGAREGIARVGLLDFQDAVIGWDAWDLSMLTQDARRAVSDAARQAALRRYLDLTGDSAAALAERLAIIGTLNALRILGVFARLVTACNRPAYATFIPRQKAELARALARPEVADMAGFIRDLAPDLMEVR